MTRASVPAGPAALDDVLLGELPALSPDEAAACLREAFGIAGSLDRISGERDLNFRVSAGESRYVLKIASEAEDVSVLAFQNAAMLHIADRDPDLPVPRVVAGRDGRHIVPLVRSGRRYQVRLLTYLAGEPALSLPASPATRRAVGGVAGRLGRALAGFDHPGADQHLIWDLRHAAALRSKIAFLPDEHRRALATRTLDEFEARVLPHADALRMQVIHNDLNQNNLLRQPGSDQVSGIIDFGDMVRSWLVAEVAIAAAHQLYRQEDVLAAMADAVAGCVDELPLRHADIAVLPSLVKARLLSRELIVAWRNATNPGASTSYRDDVSRFGWAALALCDVIDTDEARAVLAKAAGLAPARTTANEDQGTVYETLMERRARLLGPMYKQFYQTPFVPVKGEGVWVTDDRGKRYLDAYNNVPHVGHCHPHVVEAVTRQVGLFNSNTRYPSELIVDYAEKIAATMPGDLKICMFVCSGTEANELAWRIAKANSGGDGAIVTRSAFHGNSTIIAALDTSTIPRARLESWVATVPAPAIPGVRADRVAESPQAYAAHYEAAISELGTRGHRPAALFTCPVFASDGLYSAPDGYLAPAMAAVKEAGALVVADEVQSALGRTGTHFWGFQHAGIEPDIVTMAKPMGNGLPLAVVVTRLELVERFLQTERYFNTFGGNQVVAAAGIAVLEVIEREGLQAHALEIGRYLRQRLAGLMDRHPMIGDVRGTGLFVGVEIVKDRATDEPDPAATRAAIEGLLQRGVLVGITGAGRNLLKIRPPMVFSKENADLLVATLDETLRALPR